MSAAAPRATPKANTLVGLWGTEADYGPRVRGELTIDARGSGWRACISGYEVPVSRSGDWVSFTLPANAGRFRARLVPGSPVIAGQWIQPAGPVLSNAYATPVLLKPISHQVWRGQVVPNEERLSFYVSLTEDTNGSLLAVIRNMEFGWLQSRSFHVERIGDKVSLVSTGKDSNSLEGTFDAGTDHLLISLLSGAAPLVLTRRTHDSALGFYPRTPGETPYVYRPPFVSDDGWPIASLSDVGLDPAPISTLVQKILGADPKEDAMNVHSLLIARHGKLVLEEYFHGSSADRPHDMRSAGKTFAPMLLGIARQLGAKVGPETRVYSVFASSGPFANWDGRKSRMRVKDLMSMTAGYDCDEDHSPNAPGNEGQMQSQTTQPDWYKYALDLPMAHEPGGDRAYYCSAQLNLVGGVAHLAAGKALTDLFYEDFALPLQFGTYHLNLMPSGEAYMGGGAYVRARDQLKLGQLYLNRGVWNGRQIVDRDWVKQSLTVHAKFEDRLGADHEYGWGWHIHHLKVGNRVWTEYEAGGNGGQLIIILPELDMVVGFTGGAYGDFAAWGPWGIQLVSRYIIPAATN